MPPGLHLLVLGIILVGIVLQERQSRRLERVPQEDAPVIRTNPRENIRKADVAVLLVHGIGTQKAGHSRAWIENLSNAIEHDHGKLDVAFGEVYWDRDLKARSSLVVTFWLIMMLPLLAAILTSGALRSTTEYRARVHTISEQAEAVQRQLARGLISTFTYGVVVPFAAVLFLLVTWIFDPIITLATGFWRLRTTRRWRPFRLANTIFARTLGDAYMFISPRPRLGWGSRGQVLSRVIQGVEQLDSMGRRIVVIGHSLGAAISAEALSHGDVNRSLRRKTSLITVGGAQGLVSGMRSFSQTHWLNRVLVYIVCLPCAFGAVLVLSVAILGIYSVVGLMFFTYVSYVRPDAIELIEPTQLFFEEWFSAAVILVIPAVVVPSAFMAMVAHWAALLGRRPKMFRSDANVDSPVHHVDLYSRFDPVCHINGFSPARTTANVRSRRVEAWSLIAGLPIMEHISYFAPGTSSVSYLAEECARAVRKPLAPSKVALPAQEKKRRWGIFLSRITILVGVILGILMFLRTSQLVGLWVSA